jgi:hypothetical protein
VRNTAIIHYARLATHDAVSLTMLTTLSPRILLRAPKSSYPSTTASIIGSDRSARAPRPADLGAPMEIETRSFQMQNKSFVLSQCYAVTAVSLFVTKL